MNTTSKTAAGIAGVALAATAIYLFDPKKGKERRAELGGRCRSAGRRIADGSQKLGSQISDRYHAGQMRVSSWFDRTSREDATLARRVRMDLWRKVPGLKGVGIIAHEGQIILHGYVPPGEHQHVLQVVGGVEGVSSVADHLSERAPAETATQGSASGNGAHPGNAFARLKEGFTQEHWSAPARMGTGALGLALLRWGATHRNFVGGIGALTGAVLLVRSSTNTPLKQLVRRGKHAVEDSSVGEALTEAASQAAEGLQGGDGSSAQAQWRRRASA
jgi:gas vesicle protein